MRFGLGITIALFVAAIALVAVLFFTLGRRSQQYTRAVESPILVIAASPSVSPTPSPTPTPSVPTNPITGEACNNALRRPIAVMLSGDSVARPLSGIGEADMVFEMPVITGSITRYMAVFICRDPIEIGSVRSARHNYISLAKGLDAIYAHWGGSHFAMDLLKQHAIDNIDALTNPTGAYWRKDSASAPHNGFTSMTRLLKAANFLQYRMTSQAPSYPHIEDAALTSSSVKGSLKIGYPGEFEVRYEYDPAERTYARIRGGITERDRNTNAPVKARNIAVMRAVSKQIEGQYNDVALEGSGDAAVYRGGQEIPAKWHKDGAISSSKLAFTDEAGNEISFLTGNIWVEIVEPYTNVKWTEEQ
jgi:hypothetical protein